jgi:hypothetical protein
MFLFYGHGISGLKRIPDKRLWNSVGKYWKVDSPNQDNFN